MLNLGRRYADFHFIILSISLILFLIKMRKLTPGPEGSEYSVCVSGEMHDGARPGVLPSRG